MEIINKKIAPIKKNKKLYKKAKNPPIRKCFSGCIGFDQEEQRKKKTVKKIAVKINKIFIPKSKIII